MEDMLKSSKSEVTALKGSQALSSAPLIVLLPDIDHSKIRRSKAFLVGTTRKYSLHGTDIAHGLMSSPCCRLEHHRNLEVLQT